MAFVRDNNINTGDVCIFELVGKCELRVYILRVGQEGLECQNGKAAVKGSANGFGATSHKNSEADFCMCIFVFSSYLHMNQFLNTERCSSMNESISFSST